MPERTMIEGGTLVTEHGTVEADLLMDERILAVGDAGELPDADRWIDAEGKLVMPGVVDPHVHAGDHVSIDGYETVSRAAALGGVTTFVDFAWQAYVSEQSPWDEPSTLLEGVERKRANETEVLVDFGLHGGVQREDEGLLAEMPDVVDAGVTSFKMYTVYDGAVSNGFIQQVLERCADLGAVGVFHNEDPRVCEMLTERLRENGESDPTSYPDSRPDYAEAMAADDTARLAEEVGAKYYGIHTSCRKSAEAIERYRDDGSRVRAETCVHYTALDRSIHERRGNLAKIAPPIRSSDDVEATFEYLRSGTLSVVSTDHVAQLAEAKTGDWWDLPFGANGIQRSLPVFHDVAVNERGFSYPFLVRVMCANPARTFGIPWKGTLDPGTDADVVVFDPDREETITAADNASNADYTLYEGREVTGVPETTFVRGAPVADDGEVVAQPGHGEFVERAVPDWSG